MLDNEDYFEGFGRMPEEKHSTLRRTAGGLVASTPKPATKTPTQDREATASARARPRKALAAPVVSESVDALRVDLAFAKPDWDRQKDVAERPLWEIAALAMGISPMVKGITARRRLDPEWEAAYLNLVTAMCDALSPNPGKGIYYDAIKPANSSRIGNQKNLKFVRVDAASAATYVVKQRKHTPLSPEFVELQALLAHAVAATDALSSKPRIAAPLPSPQKDQEKANETKASKILTTLLYVVVEQELGWAGASVGGGVDPLLFGDEDAVPSWGGMHT